MVSSFLPTISLYITSLTVDTFGYFDQGFSFIIALILITEYRYYHSGCYFGYLFTKPMPRKLIVTNITIVNITPYSLSNIVFPVERSK
uniref:Uncharacterized protein n=1 Tax=Tetranychus urticae TaxID=32264 RepID=T1KSA6_TETUR